MQLSRGAVKKDYIDASDAYTVRPLLQIIDRDDQYNQDSGPAERDDRDAAEDKSAYAKNIIDIAQAERQKIIADAKLEAEAIRKREYQRGYEEGHSCGLQEGRGTALAQAQDVRREAQDVLDEAHRISREYIDGRKEEIVNLAINIASKLIGYKCSLDDEAISKVLNDSISSCVAKKQLIIRVNPMDYALVDCRMDEIAKKTGEKVVVKLMRDGSVRRGGCRLESESSHVDADINSQLDRIKEALLSKNV